MVEDLDSIKGKGMQRKMLQDVHVDVHAHTVFRKGACWHEGWCRFHETSNSREMVGRSHTCIVIAACAALFFCGGGPVVRIRVLVIRVLVILPPRHAAMRRCWLAHRAWLQSQRYRGVLRGR